MKKTKGKAGQFNQNPIEQLLRSMSGAGSQASESTINANNWSEYLGIKEKQRGGVLKPGQEVDLRKHEKKEEKSSIEPGINYSREVVQVAEVLTNRENKEIEVQLREIMIEIKKLTDSSKDLQIQFKEVAVEQHIANPGEYHKSFFSWLLSLIRAARNKVEDSGAWLQAMHSKKKTRGYSAMAKKRGTSFTQSMDRNVATQVG